VRRAKLTIGLLVAVVVLIVFFQNNDPVSFRFLFFSPVQIPKTLLILGAAAAGALLAVFVQYQRGRRRV
jgi:uncharacterized integral membrane protein